MGVAEVGVKYNTSVIGGKKLKTVKGRGTFIRDPQVHKYIISDWYNQCFLQSELWVLNDWNFESLITTKFYII